MGEQCEAVRQIATSGSNMQRIAQVIQHIKTDFTKSLRIEDLADRAKMSPSSFHHHFKQVTSMSPLNYQKQLRLLEARRLMLTEKSTAATAADRVGYESPSQFSREYSRMFGAPPIQDIERLLKCFCLSTFDWCRRHIEPLPFLRHPRHFGVALCGYLHPFRLSAKPFQFPAWPCRVKQYHRSCLRVCLPLFLSRQRLYFHQSNILTIWMIQYIVNHRFVSSA